MKHTFKVRMPQLVAAFVPIVTVLPTVNLSIQHATHSVKLLVLITYVVIVLLAVVGIITVGVRTHLFTIDDTSISLGKKRLPSSEIRSIKVRNRTVDVSGASWKTRITVALQKEDLQRALPELSKFAHAHGIEYSVK